MGKRASISVLEHRSPLWVSSSCSGAAVSFCALVLLWPAGGICPCDGFFLLVAPTVLGLQARFTALMDIAKATSTSLSGLMACAGLPALRLEVQP